MKEQQKFSANEYGGKAINGHICLRLRQACVLPLISVLLLSCTSQSSQNTASSRKQRVLLTDSVNNSQPVSAVQPAVQPASPPLSQPVVLTGMWRIGFECENKVFSSTVNIVQQGQSFQGTGTDDQTNHSFTILGGTINGSNISFSKKYDNVTAEPIQYIGQFSILKEGNFKGPYMGGQYKTSYQNKYQTGEWEAMMIPANEKSSQTNAPASEDQTNTAEDSGKKAPHLSGKWNTGYEWNFGTIHSTMYLEQDGGKITGHGIDLETKEKFVITKGWYKYPSLTLVRTYPKGKKGWTKGQLTFKADVSYVNDKDYQGPYLSGKTEGGGAWEAELVK